MDTPGTIPDEIVVRAAEAGRRADLVLHDRLPGCSRGHVRRQIEKGNVLRNGRPLRKGDFLEPGDTIDLGRFTAPGDVRAAAAAGDDLVVLFEDREVVVVEKEAGLPSLPKDEDDTHALACRLVARYPALRFPGPPLEAGLLHRLDTATSGILVAAKTPAAHGRLREAWRRRRVEKEYIALVHGEVLRSFTMLLPIDHHPRSARRMIACAGGRSAETRFRPLLRGTSSSLLLAGLREGRRHQIRVHLAEAGHPVAGDRLYGEEGGGRFTRLMLHAAGIRFAPRPGGEDVRVVSPPPEEFLHVVKGELGASGEEAIRRYLSARSRGR